MSDFQGLAELAGMFAAFNERLTVLERALPEVFRLIGATGQPVFTNSWVNFDNGLTTPTNGQRNAGFYRHDGRTYLVGIIKNGTVGQPAFTLPAEYWPHSTEAGPTALHRPVISNSASGEVDVWLDGRVFPQVGNNAWFNLGAVSFRHI